MQQKQTKRKQTMSRKKKHKWWDKIKYIVTAKAAEKMESI